MKDTAGRYCASFVGAVEPPTLETRGKSVGMDPGLASLAVTSEGEMIAPARFLRSPLKWIRRLQRSLSRKVKGCGNRQKARFRLARAHIRVGDQRLDHLHQLSTRRIGENRTVVLEDLNVWGMAKNHKPARAIADAGWLLLRRLLACKAEMYGREVKGRSQTCSACGHLAANEGREEGRPCPEVFSLWRRAPPRGEWCRRHPHQRAGGEVKRLWSREAERLTGVLASGSEAGTPLNEGVQACAT